jgi:hypothetical protein
MQQKYKVFINNQPKIIDHNWNQFCEKYKMIYASGGVVFNNEKLLMIFRNGFWDLPKGKIEINESVAQAIFIFNFVYMQCLYVLFYPY